MNTYFWWVPLAATMLALVATPSGALQVVEARDGVTVEAVIATKEATRIRIEDAPITEVFGNLYSSNCAPPAAALAGAVSSAPPPVNPAGEIALECDRDKGEIYVRPVGSSSKPINLFVASRQATYTLLLRRSDTPSDTIVIRDKIARRAGNAASERQGPLGVSTNPLRAMKGLLVAMSSDRMPGDLRVEVRGEPVHLWREARFFLVRTVEGRGLLGEQYLLTNTSGTPMVLAEPEFDRAGADVVGIAIENHNLRPGERTPVYVIRAERQP